MIDPTRAQIIYGVVDMRPANVSGQVWLASLRYEHEDKSHVQGVLDSYLADSVLGGPGYDWRLATIIIEPNEVQP